MKDEQLALAWWALRLSEICGFSPFLYCLLSYRGIPPTGNRSSLLQIMGARLFSSEEDDKTTDDFLPRQH